MSQVKKLQSGGNTPPKGKFRMNGRELDGQTALDRMSALYGQMPLDEREMFTVAQRAILDGNIAEYDPTDNTIRVYDQNGNSLVKNYTDSTASVKDSGFRKFTDALLNTQNHRFKKSGRKFALMDMTDPSEAISPAELEALRRGSGWFVYDKGDNGKLVYRSDSPTNQQKLSILDSLYSTFPLYTDVASLKKKYSTKNWNDQDLETLVNYYKTITDKDAFIKGLKERIQNPENLKPSDIEFLNLHGFMEDDTTKAAAAAAAQEAADRENDPLRIDDGWEGNRDAAKNAGIGFKYKDGHWYVTGAEKYANNNWYLGGVDWALDTPFKEGFIVNGRLYTEDEAYNNPGEAKEALARWFAAKNAKDWRSRYDIWANSGFKFINDRTGHENDETPYYGAFNTRFDPTTDYAPIWYRYFTKRGNVPYDINAVTNNFGNTGKKQIISYIDPKASNLGGMFKPKYAVYDPDSKQIYTYNDEASMMRAQGLTPSGNIWSTSTPFDYSNWQNVNGVDYANYRTFGPAGQTNTIWIDRDGKYYLGRRDAVNGTLVDPKLIKNLQGLQLILDNPDKYSTWRNSDIENILMSIPRGDKAAEFLKSQSFIDNPENLIPLVGPFIQGFKGLEVLTTPTAATTPEEMEAQKEFQALLTKYANSDGLLTKEGRDAWWKAISDRRFWNYIFADGGRIPKFQFGGANDVAITEAVKGQDVTEAPTDITKFHKINGKDGGLTEAEWIQIGAACGDLAGVAATFIPVPGVGAAIGAAASVTHFVGDIKQDGFQARDLKNLGINLLLDAASIIPYAGTFAATTKVAKVLKGCRPILKLLAVAGVGSAAMNAAKKIVNGEEWTSADVIQTIQGLASLGIVGAGAKSKFNSAKLAQKVEAKAIERATKMAAKPKVGTAGGYEMRKSAEEVASMVNGKTKAQAVKAVQEAAKAEKQIDLKEEDAVKILKDFGVELDVKGPIKWKMPWQKGAFTRGEGTLNYEIPEAPTAHSTLHFYLNSKARAKMLGSENVYGFQLKTRENPSGLFGRYRQKGHLDLLSEADIRRANPMRVPKSALPADYTPYKMSAADKALARISAENPRSLGKLLYGPNGELAPIVAKPEWGTWGGYRYYRDLKYPSISTKVSYTPPTTTTRVTSGPFGQPWQAPATDPNILRRRNLILNRRRWMEGNAPFVKRAELHLLESPLLIKGPGTSGSYFFPKKFTGAKDYNFVVYKKGGKIYTAQNGANTDTFDIQKIMEILKNPPKDTGFRRKIDNPITRPNVGPIKAEATYGGKKFSIDTDESGKMHLTNLEDTTPKIVTSQTVSSNTTSQEHPGGSWGSLGKINKANLNDLLRAGVTIAGINKDKRLQKRALDELKKRQFITPHTDLVQYNFSDIERGADQASEPIKNASLQTSSLRDHMAFELSKSQKLSDIQANKNANISKRMMDIDEANRKITSINSTNEANMANQKSQYLTQLNYQDKMKDSEALNRIYANVIGPLGKQFGDQSRRAQLMEAQAEYDTDMDLAATAAKHQLNNALRTSGIKGRWDALTEAEKTKYGNDIMDYAYAVDPNNYTKIMDTYGVNLKDAKRAATAKMRQYIGPNLYIHDYDYEYDAKGGKIGNNVREASDQIAINSDREAKKAAQKLSDNLMRMLAQLLK